MPITIRPATLNDTAFVARGIVMALHLDPEEADLPHIARICAREDVLYSYKHTLLACLTDQVCVAGQVFAAGTPIGLCLAYDGARYSELRERTFALFASNPSESDRARNEELDLEHMEDEAAAGEYYIDSLAVLEPFRRQGFARQLMLAQLEQGRQFGLLQAQQHVEKPIQKATLLVDPANGNAQALYRQCGFTHVGEVYAFGQTYWKWQVLYPELEA